MFPMLILRIVGLDFLRTQEMNELYFGTESPRNYFLILQFSLFGSKCCC